MADESLAISGERSDWLWPVWVSATRGAFLAELGQPRAGMLGSEAELHRLRGELLRVGGREREARSAFFRALAVAREQGALLLELRATVRLSRLLRDTGRPEVARRLLSRILGRFEAGVDSADLADARMLLEHLSGGEVPGVVSP